MWVVMWVNIEQLLKCCWGCWYVIIMGKVDDDWEESEKGIGYIYWGCGVSMYNNWLIV